MNKEDLYKSVAHSASVIKLVCGAGNNAAWLVCLDAHDRIREHRRYKTRVKGGHTVGWSYRQALKMYHDYERRLLHSPENRMFCVADMSPEVRKRYGAITDRDYYDFWTGIGASAYTRTRPLVTSLWNKYRLSLQKHGIRQPDLTAWSMTAQACLELAVAMYDAAVEDCSKGYNIPKPLLERIFGQFSLKEIARVWRRALDETDPETETYQLDHTEDRNIRLGLEQLHEAWLNPDTLYQSTIKTVRDYEEIFRTAGESKKAIREIGELESVTNEELQKQ